jgi:uracil-DNA glycosylase
MSKELLFIGQALPEKPTDYPFARSRLYKWLEKIGLNKEQVLEIAMFNAVLDFYPGKNGRADRHPTWQEILKNQNRLGDLVNTINPKVIVAIGKIAVQAILNTNEKIELVDFVGKKFEIIPFNIGDKVYPVIVLPHPSGLSTWIYKSDNQELLDKALNEIRKCLDKI